MTVLHEMSERLGSNQLRPVLSTVLNVPNSECSEVLSLSTAKLNLPSVGIVAMVNLANTWEELTV